MSVLEVPKAVIEYEMQNNPDMMIVITIFLVFTLCIILTIIGAKVINKFKKDD